jgi:phospholipase C
LYQDDFDVAGQDLFNLFENFIEAGPGNPLYYRGSTYFANNTLDAFYADALNGTLPAVSWLIPEQALSEHPPWIPENGGWLQKQIAEAVMNGKSWNDTVLLISYDGLFS